MNIKKTVFVAISMMFFAASSFAQESKWAVGLTGGFNNNQIVLNKGYAYDYQYKDRLGYNLSIVGRYQFNDWLAARADLRLTSRNYKMERGSTMFSDLYTKYRNTYLQLPVVADFSFGGEKIRGHFYAGGYASYWLDSHRKGESVPVILPNADRDQLDYTFDEKVEFNSKGDNRLGVGLTCGAGISYRITSHWEVMAEAFYQYDVTSSSKSQTISMPRYNNTLSFSTGIMYNF